MKEIRDMMQTNVYSFAGTVLIMGSCDAFFIASLQNCSKSAGIVVVGWMLYGSKAMLVIEL